MFTVAIIGRPNVGKSTLFNRLAGRRMALVHDMPGVTRDRRAAPGELFGIDFEIIDTAGLEEAFDDSVAARMRRQTERVLDQAHVVLLLIDSRAGVTPMDKHFGAWLRKASRPVILVANKCEGRAGLGGLVEAFEMGLGEPVAISAEHGEGMADLHEAMLPFFRQYVAVQAAAEIAAEEQAAEQAEPAEALAEGEDTEPDAEAAASDERHKNEAISVAIVGRPNVGKSTLLNAILGEDRVITGPEAGLTRDAITAGFSHKGRALQLVDTAGMRRRAKVDDPLERLAVSDGMNAVRYAHVVVLLLDAGAVLDNQELTLARHVIEEGRALVIGLNKWDAVENRQASLQRLKNRLETSLGQARGVPYITLSALRGERVVQLLDAVVRAYMLWNKRIATHALNRWLMEVTQAHPPPLVQGRRLKLRYITQVKSRPPTFALWANKPLDLPESYTRYMMASLRDTFKLDGVPLRINLRKGNNPYVKD
jgi:GTPase